MPDGENREIIVRFERVTEAIMAEEALAEAGFAVRVMPTPSGIRKGCGFCLRFAPEDAARAAAFLAERGIAVTAGYIREETDRLWVYKKVRLSGPPENPREENFLGGKAENHE